MKKLLLPILALSLAGCGIAAKSNEQTWTTIKENETLAIVAYDFSITYSHYDWEVIEYYHSTDYAEVRYGNENYLRTNQFYGQIVLIVVGD